MQQLITKEVEKTLKKYPLYSQENEEEEIIILHFFSCYFSFDAYVVEAYKKRDGWHFYGYQSIGNGFEKGELASEKEMNEINLKYKSKNIQMIERETYFRKIKSKVLKERKIINEYEQ